MESKLSDLAPGTKIGYLQLVWIITDQKKSNRIFCRNTFGSGGGWFERDSMVKVIG